MAIPNLNPASTSNATSTVPQAATAEKVEDAFDELFNS